MNTEIFNIKFQMWMSIGETLIHSLWIGMIFWVISWFILQVVPKKRPEIRYWVSILSVFLFFAVVCQLLLYSYGHSSGTKTNPSDVNMDTYFQMMLYRLVTYEESRLSAALIFSWLWFFGLVFMLIRFCVASAYTYWIGYKATPIVDSFMTDTLKEMKHQLGINEDVSIKFTDKVSAIFTYGFFKPVIIWPVALLNSLDEDEATMIIAHELMHIGRKDFLVKVILSLINTVLYYHPFIWWANKVVDTERELACDLGAIKLCSTQTQYANTLIKLQELKLNLLAPVANGFSDNKNFSNRIKRLFNMPVQNNSAKARLTILLLLITTVGLFAYEYHKNSFDKNKPQEKTETKDNNSALSDVLFENFVAVRDTMPIKSRSKSTQVITRMEGDNTTTIKMEDGKVVEVEVNGEKIDESEFEKYVNKGEDATVIRKRRGIDSEDFEFDTEEFMKNMPFLKFEEEFDGDLGQKFGFAFKNLENLDSIFSKKLKNFNFNFNQHNLDSLMGGRMKIFGFGDDMKGFQFDIDSFVNGFRLELDDMDGDPMVIRRRPDARPGRNDRESRERAFEFMKPEKMMLTQVLEKQLKKDGLLKSGKVNKVELNHKQLKINGEKMPEVIFEKYKNIYENETGLSLQKGNNVVFEVEHKEKNSKEYKTF